MSLLDELDRMEAPDPATLSRNLTDARSWWPEHFSGTCADALELVCDILDRIAEVECDV